MSAEWWRKPWALFDTETTGVDPKKDRIVTWSFIAFHPVTGSSSAKFGLINPGVKIPKEASRVHGITNRMAREQGEQPHASLTRLLQLVERCVVREVPIVAYNAAFDMTILHHEAWRHNATDEQTLIQLRHASVLDPLVIDKKFDRYRKGSRRLQDLCERYSVPLDNAHDAAEDALATGKLLKAMLSVHDDLYLPLRRLHYHQVKWYREQAISYEQYLMKKGERREISKIWPIAE